MQVTIIIAQFILSTHSPYKTIDYSIQAIRSWSQVFQSYQFLTHFFVVHTISSHQDSVRCTRLNKMIQLDCVRVQHVTPRSAARQPTRGTLNFLSRSDNSHIDQVLTFITTGRVTVETGVTPIAVAVVTAVVITAIYSVVVRPEVSGLTRNCVKEKR